MRELTPASVVLRLVMVGTILGSAVTTGVLRRSPLAVLTLAVGFTGAYVGGKLPQWRRSWARHGPMSLLGLPVTYAIQCVMAGVCYLVGVGLGSLFSERLWLPFDPADALVGVAIGLFGLVVGPVIDRLEGVGPSEG